MFITPEEAEEFQSAQITYEVSKDFRHNQYIIIENLGANSTPICLVYTIEDAEMILNALTKYRESLNKS